MPLAMLSTPMNPLFAQPVVEAKAPPVQYLSSLPLPQAKSAPQSRMRTWTVVALVTVPRSRTFGLVADRKCGVVLSGEVITLVGGGVCRITSTYGPAVGGVTGEPGLATSLPAASIALAKMSKVLPVRVVGMF